MDETKIARAVKTCVAYAAESDRPFRQVADFLMVLRVANWPADELGEVQERVLKQLGERHLASRDRST